MELISFSITNFRSITTAYKLRLSNYTVLVGPNNEGKSNILKALAISLALLTRGRIIRLGARTSSRYVYQESERFDYEWLRDFPIDLQSSFPNGRSEFVLEFRLSQSDTSAFNMLTASNLATNLKLKVSCGHRDIAFDILIQGRAKKQLAKKKEVISDFVRDRVLIQYIPSIRTSELAIDVVDNLLSTQLQRLEEQPEYRRLIEQLSLIQRPILDTLGQQLTKTISAFITDVQDITLETESRLRGAIRSSTRVLINDGVKTDLHLKGDGVISLTAISLLRHLSQEALGKKSLILAIEEPESHLHPRAVHGLRKVLHEIAQTHQVFISTHSQALIDRQTVSNNIIVQKRTATPANDFADVRSSLGLELSDNLASAYLVLLTEGQEDQILLKAWLSALSTYVGDAIKNGQLAFDNLAGATNLSYKASFYRNNACNVHAFLDNDDDGRRATNRAIEKDIINPADYNLCVCKGMPDSEIEDLIDVDIYKKAINEKFAVLLQGADFQNSTKKWSDRVRTCFLNQGKQWSDTIENEVKYFVCTLATQQQMISLNAHKRGSIEALTQTLEQKLRYV